MDEHKPSDAPNRLTRRYVEQENKKNRDVEKKKFNELVKKLTTYVKRRDPRIMKEEERKRKQKEKAEKDKLERVRKKQKKFNLIFFFFLGRIYRDRNEEMETN